MITTYLQGGLGNQMFQIAAAYSLAKINNDNCIFDFNSCHTPHQGNSSLKYKDNFFKKIPHEIGVNKKIENVYVEQKHSYQEIPYSNNLQLQGFFQSEKYFIDKDEIINLFQFNPDKINSTKKYLERLGNKPKTSVHIRRGDYLKFKNVHPVCDLDYYKRAIELIGDTTLIFISDDLSWVKSYFDGIYSPYSDELDDLLLMTLCDNNIIANSSFSWWGAYLNKNENKKIISPREWFGVNGPKDQQDIIPEDWIKT